MFFESFVNELLTSLADTFTLTRKRVFWGYLLAAAAISLLWLKYGSKLSLSEGIARVFNRSIWWSESAKADYRLFVLNRIVSLLIAPYLLSQSESIRYLFEQLHHWFARPLPGSILPDWAVVLSFTIFIFVLDDFARFYLHRLMHRWNWLWAFHKVHHSARTMTPMTVFRTHPVEGVLFALRSVLVQSVSIALFIFMFGSQVDLWTVLGANVFLVLFNITGSNLRHSHISLYYWRPLEKILISPMQHQIHHSTEVRHFDKNFGAALAIWDWLGGTLHHSEPGLELAYGVSKKPGDNEHSLKQLYLVPFREAFLAVLKQLRRLAELSLYLGKKKPE